MLSLQQLEASLPLLEQVPWPILRVSQTFQVLWGNAQARLTFGPCQGRCYMLTHHSETPCGERGEPCPLVMLRSSKVPVVVTHAHATATGLGCYRTTALPVSDGSVLELQVPLGEDVTRDLLTGLYTRAFFTPLADRHVSLLERIGCDYAVMLVDVDRLKELNDVHSHQAGDEALRAVGEIIIKETRQGDLQGRWGGDEFVIFVPSANATRAVLVAGRILASVQQIVVPTAAHAEVSVSIGIASGRPHETFTQALKRADEALYVAKAQGRNRVAVAPEAG